MSTSGGVKQQTFRSPGKILLGVIVGAAIAVTGFLIGHSSHHVAYQKIAQNTIADYIAGNGVDYLQLNGSPALYTIKDDDFNPTFSADVLGNGNISLAYLPENTTDIDVSSVRGTHLAGKAYKVVEITVFDNNQQRVYTTSDYSRNPGGFDINNWLLGGTILGFGLVIAVLALIVPGRVFTMLAYTVAGAGILVVLVLIFVGIIIPTDKTAITSVFTADAFLFGGAIAIGGAIGLIVGVVQAIRGRDFA
jgi:hypothetical protein